MSDDADGVDGETGADAATTEPVGIHLGCAIRARCTSRFGAHEPEAPAKDRSRRQWRSC